MTTAGTPSLNRHVPREEAEARIEAALKVAREADAWRSGRQVTSVGQRNVALEAISNIIRILENGAS